MKRELKDQFFSALLQRPPSNRTTPYEEGTERRFVGTIVPTGVARNRTTPYEEGTESRILLQLGQIPYLVTEPLPMKRELKG